MPGASPPAVRIAIRLGRRPGQGGEEQLLDDRCVKLLVAEQLRQPTVHGADLHNHALAVL